MRRRRLTSILLTVGCVISVLPVAAASVSVNVPEDQLALGLGEERQSYITVYNQLDEPAAIHLRAEPSTDVGELYVQLLDRRNATSNTRTIDVAPDANRTVPVSYEAAFCPDTLCSKSVTFTVRSLETDDTVTESVSVAIDRDRDIYGAPGITGIQLLLLAVLGALLAVRYR